MVLGEIVMEKGFTLVISLYNKVNVFRNTLESVLRNHGEYPFKCIIVDDDSTDGSSEIGEEYDTKYPEVFTYIKKKHRGYPGPSFARNLGIKLTDTEYIGFLDCDDEICPGFIDRGCRFLDEHPEYSLYANGHIDREIDLNNGFNDIEVKYKNIQITNVIDFLSAVATGYKQVHFSASIYKTEIVKQTLFNDIYAEDLDFQIRYLYYNPDIYIDYSTCQSIIHNISYSDSDTWYFPRNTSSCMEEIMFNLKHEIPDFKYDYRIAEDGVLWFWERG